MQTTTNDITAQFDALLSQYAARARAEAPAPRLTSAEEARALMRRSGLDPVPAGFAAILGMMKDDTMAGHRGWLMRGGVGTGKTTRARLAADFAGIEMATAQSLYDDALRPDVPKWQATRVGTLSTFAGRLRSCDLIIDDLGVEPPAATLYGTLVTPLATLIEARYERWPQMRTYITTNLTADEIQERYGARVASRLAEMCPVITLTGQDRRRAR